MWRSSPRSIGADEVIVAWLRICYTCLAGAYLLRGGPAPVSNDRGGSLTVLFIVQDWPLYNAERQRFTAEHMLNSV
jgi:hypothetical protein